MPRLQLRIYVKPEEVELFCALKLKNGTYRRLACIIDTGAAVSFFPIAFLDNADYELKGQGTVTIEQAGIAKQSFQAIEALVTIRLEDASGNVTDPFQVPAWFADSAQPLIGFEGILERAILHIDMPARSGWLEIDA